MTRARRSAGACAAAAALTACLAGGGCATSSSSPETETTTTTATATGGGGEGGATFTTTTATGGAGGEGGEGGTGAGSPCPPDADGDAIPDEVEGKSQGLDTDGDGTPDYLDLDSDGDSIPDAFEGQTQSVGCQTPQDSDGDGTADFQDTDSDDNGLPDLSEVHPDGSPYDPNTPPADTDGDGFPDYADDDNDGDALLDVDEVDADQAVDTDGDGVPDLDDLDSDDDSIADAFEGFADPDGDDDAAFRDLDSDGDGLLDACEAGPGHALADPPPDTDNDGKYDFLDLDADGDGIVDAVEDANADCVVDLGETSPFAADTDGDGADDLVETVLGSDAADPIVTPGTLGKFWFVLPYQQAPAPVDNVVPLRTQLNQGDVAFIVDTTATMGGEIQNLKTDIASIITQLYGSIPDLAVGVAGFDDFPTGNYGVPGIDLPFYVSGPTGFVSPSLADNLGAVLALNVHDGGDFAESHVAAMQRALTDGFLLWPGGQIAPAGAPGATYGSLHFRSGSLPILVAVTDAAFHNGRRTTAPGTLHDPYSFNGTPPFPTPTVDDLVATITSKGGRFLGISSSDGVRNGGDPYEDLAYLCDHTESYAPPSAFGGISCPTGLGGSLVLPDGPATMLDPAGTCRLVFDVTTSGNGVSASVVSGVQAVLKSIHLDLRALATPDAGPVDAVDSFIETIAVNASGGNDESEPAVPCFALNPVLQLTDIWSGPKGLLQVQDAVNETALGIVPTQKICFKVTAKQNDLVPQTTGPQVFKATLIVKAKNGAAPTELLVGTPKEIAFIVPPSPQ